MRVLRVLYGAFRCLGVLGAAAVVRLGADSTRSVGQRVRRPTPGEELEGGLDARFPSQSDRAALLGLFVSSS
jgi:hypothetical protein